MARGGLGVFKYHGTGKRGVIARNYIAVWHECKPSHPAQHDHDHSVDLGELTAEGIQAHYPQGSTRRRAGAG